MRRLETKLASIPSSNGHTREDLLRSANSQAWDMGECGNFLSLSSESTPYCRGIVETITMESIFADFVPDKKGEHGD